MNDKWNPRLWLRDWLNKPSIAEGVTPQCSLESPTYKVQLEEGKVAGISILADRFSVTQQGEPPLFPEWLARMRGVGAEIVDRRASIGLLDARSTTSPSPCPLEREGARPESSELPGFAGTSDHP